MGKPCQREGCALVRFAIRHIQDLVALIRPWRFDSSHPHFPFNHDSPPKRNCKQTR